MSYFDNQLKMPITDRVKQAYLRGFFEHSLDAPYQSNHKLANEYNQAIDSILKNLGATKNSQFCLMSSSSEGLAHILQSVYIDHIAKTGKNQILHLNVEDADLLLSMKRYEALGVITTEIPVHSNGMLSLAALKMHATKKTTLLTLSWSQRLTGVLQPLHEIALYCQQHQILLHVDISGEIGNQFFELADFPIDFITFEGSRIGAPIGTAGLIVQSPSKFTSMIPSSIENQLKGGPIHMGGVFALQAAIEQCMEDQDHVCIETAQLKNAFEETIKEKFNATIFFEESERLPYVSAFAIPYIHGELLAFALAENDMQISYGGGQMQRLESIISLAGYDATLSKCAVAVSLSSLTTDEDIDRLIQVLEEIYKQYYPMTQAITQELENASPF